jgi:hypothetical protein
MGYGSYALVSAAICSRPGLRMHPAADLGKFLRWTLLQVRAGPNPYLHAWASGASPVGGVRRAGRIGRGYPGETVP